MSLLKKIKEITKEHIKSFDKDHLNKVARETSFVQRTTNKVSGRDFVELMSVEHFDKGVISLEGLCDILRGKSSESDMTPQALNKKINSKNAVVFLERILEDIYRDQLKPRLEKIPIEVLESFRNVYIQDSTQIELNEHLSEEFKGVGGSASKSGLKIDLLYDVGNHILKNVFITEGTYPDQKNGARVKDQIGEGDLIIRDLGYFELSGLAEIQGKGAYYLSRLFKSAKVYLSQDVQAEAIDLPRYVKKQISDRGFIDTTVYLGKERLSCRLIAYRAPAEVINERRRKARRAAQRKGKALSLRYLDWLDFSFYITNIDSGTWLPEIVGTIYRIRWQIELIFKQWKQLFRIHVMKGSRAERIRCLLYGRLIMIGIVTRIYGFSTWYAYCGLGREVSMVKLIQWLQRKGRLCQAITNDSLSSLMEDLFNSLSTGLLKQKRRRKTTFELIKSRVGFLESFL